MKIFENVTVNFVNVVQEQIMVCGGLDVVKGVISGLEGSAVELNIKNVYSKLQS